MFSTFPGGSPGFGLLILRCALGVTASLRGILLLSETEDSLVLSRLAGSVGIILGAFLLAGFLTPVISLTTACAAFLALLTVDEASIVTAINTLALAAALVFLGPGAFSLDARLFGRREIVIPKNSAAPGE